MVQDSDLVVGFSNIEVSGDLAKSDSCGVVSTASRAERTEE